MPIALAALALIIVAVARSSPAKAATPAAPPPSGPTIPGTPYTGQPTTPPAPAPSTLPAYIGVNSGFHNVKYLIGRPFEPDTLRSYYVSGRRIDPDGTIVLVLSRTATPGSVLLTDYDIDNDAQLMKATSIMLPLAAIQALAMATPPATIEVALALTDAGIVSRAANSAPFVVIEGKGDPAVTTPEGSALFGLMGGAVAGALVGRGGGGRGGGRGGRGGYAGFPYGYAHAYPSGGQWWWNGYQWVWLPA